MAETGAGNRACHVVGAGNKRDSSRVFAGDAMTNSTLSHHPQHARADLPEIADLSTENLQKRVTKCA